METHKLFKEIPPDINKLQILSQDIEQHKEWKASKTGGIDPEDVIYIRGDNNANKLILPILRKHKTLVYFIILLAYSIFWLCVRLGIYGWF